MQGSNLNVQNSTWRHTGSGFIAGLAIHAVKQPQSYKLDSFKLCSSPEYLLRDWSFLTARPRAFF